MRAMQVERDREASTDHLTGACNARSFRALALVEVDRARRHHRELSLAYVDVDDFKAINDGLGHTEGDRVLLEVSHVMRSSWYGRIDTVARLGGDEFVVLLPETDASQSRVVVDRLRVELARLRTTDDGPVPCSIGLVTFVDAPRRCKSWSMRLMNSCTRRRRKARTESSRPLWRASAPERRAHQAQEWLAAQTERDARPGLRTLLRRESHRQHVKKPAQL